MAISDETTSTENSSTVELEADLGRSFYEGVVLLSLLGPLEEFKTSRSVLKSNIEAGRTPWHDFLDHLSWLGDYKCGGKTVTSIAAEALPRGSRFWIACNQRPQTKSFEHLCWILHEIQSLVNDSSTDLERVQHRIIKKSIQFSCLRVKNYGRKLCGFIEHSTYLHVKKPGRPGEYRGPNPKAPDLTLQHRCCPSRMPRRFCKVSK